MNWSKVKRISIVGPSGSGKSTLAVKLGKVLNLPVHHIDCYFIKPGWQAGDKLVVAKQIEEVTKTDEWIIDGNYKLTLENRFKRSDLIIFLNFPLEFCIQSIKQRHDKKERLGLPEYLKPEDERLTELLDKVTEKGRYATLVPLCEKHKHKVIELSTREQVNDFEEKYAKRN